MMPIDNSTLSIVTGLVEDDAIGGQLIHQVDRLVAGLAFLLRAREVEGHLVSFLIPSVPSLLLSRPIVSRPKSARNESGCRCWLPRPQRIYPKGARDGKGGSDGDDADERE
ncbi:hypothetical protein BHE74_00030428 [Ensete ventricosum]|nr:hypothetical protein BHE74_00030428 [Ensete ventricosum]